MSVESAKLFRINLTFLLVDPNNSHQVTRKFACRYFLSCKVHIESHSSGMRETTRYKTVQHGYVLEKLLGMLTEQAIF